MGTHEWDKYLNFEDLEGMLRPAVTVAKAGVNISNLLTNEMDEYPNWLRANYMMIVAKWKLFNNQLNYSDSDSDVCYLSSSFVLLLLLLGI